MSAHAVRDEAAARLRRIPLGVRLALLVVYGCVAGLLALSAWDAPPFTMMSVRAEDVSGAIRTLEAGGPPLLRCDAGSEPELRRGAYLALVERGACAPAGTTDDQGLSLIVPYVAQLTGTGDAATALHRLFEACFFLAFAAYPLVFLAVMGSWLAALAAPWLLMSFHSAFVVSVDHYWVSAWGVLLGLPLVFVAYRHWHRLGRWAWLLLGAAALLGSFVTAMRINAGLPIAIACVLVALMRAPRWRSRLALSALVVAAYLVVYPFGLQGVRAYRDHTIGDPTLSDRYPSRHPLWHAAYIGLGIVPNRYGISWNDAVSAAFVASKDANVEYLSPRYERILRREYFRLVVHDPGLVFRNYLVKTDRIFRDALSRFWWGLLFVPAALLVGPRRHLVRRYVLLATPAALLGALPPVMTNPEHEYQMAWLGGIGVIAMLGLTWAAAEVGALVSGRRQLGPVRAEAATAARGALGSAWSSALLVVAGLVVAIVTLRIALEPDYPKIAYYQTHATPLAEAANPGPARADWSFAGGVAAGWAVTPGTLARPGHEGLEISTSKGRYAYQLEGPTLTLEPGRYVLELRGAVVDGGLEARLLDAELDRWVTTASYWSGQKPAGGRYAAFFELSKPTIVRVILANWAESDRISTWRLRSVTLSSAAAREAAR